MSPTATKTGDRKAPSITSLDTQVTSCTPEDCDGGRSTSAPDAADEGSSDTPVYSDTPWAHAYRRALAEHLEKPWPTRAKAIRNCGKAALVMRCRECDAPHLVEFRCGSRTCPTCAWRGAAGVADRVAPRVLVFDALQEAEPWDGRGKPLKRGWKLLTLTYPASPDLEDRFDPLVLSGTVDAVLKATAGFWRRTPWGRQVKDRTSGKKRSRRDTAAIRAIEVSPRGMAHVHLLVYGEYVRQRELQRLWEEVLGVECAIVDIRAVRDVPGVIREVVKYATKAEGSFERKVAYAAAVELAFRNRRRVEYIGAIRDVKVGDAAGDTDDIRLEDVCDSRYRACEICGAVGGWYWIDNVDSRVVGLNGGFGYLKPGRAYMAAVRPDVYKAEFGSPFVE